MNAGIMVAILGGAVLVFAPGAMAHDAGTSDEHGTLTLSFEMVDEECEITVIGRNVDVPEATLRIIRTTGTPPHPVVDHDEQVLGIPEAEGDGFRYEEGPFTQEGGAIGITIRLQWDEGDHALSHRWSTNDCKNDPGIRVHEDEDSGAVSEIEGCTLFVEGRYVRHEEGEVRVVAFHSDAEYAFPVTTDDTTPEEDATGHRFLVGPIEVDLSGRYSVRFHDDLDEPSHASMRIDVVGCSTEPAQCPPDVAVEARDHANVITWDDVQDARHYNIYRAEPGEDMALIAQQGHSSYQDHDSAGQPTMEYRVTAVNEIGESSGCPRVAAEEPPVVCPPVDFRAIAQDDERVTVHADGLDRPAELHRAVAGTDDFEHVATLDEGNTTFRDTGTEAQTTYEYRLMVDGETCATVEVTAIPVFPGFIVAALATVAGLGAYGAIARRRRD